MMGVHPGTHFLAWFLENAAVVAVGSAVLAVLLKTSGIFAYSDAFLVFLFLLDFGVSVIALSYLLSALFRRASTAALCSSLLYVTSFLPYVILLVLRGRLGAAAQACLVGGPPGEGAGRGDAASAAVPRVRARPSRHAAPRRRGVGCRAPCRRRGEPPVGAPGTAAVSGGAGGRPWARALLEDGQVW